MRPALIEAWLATTTTATRAITIAATLATANATLAAATPSIIASSCV